MSAIGEYVHYYYKNYLENGIYREQTFQSLESQQSIAYENQKRQLNEKINKGQSTIRKETLQDIESFLNIFLKNDFNKLNSKRVEEIKQVIQKEIKSKFENIIESIDQINTSLLKVESLSNENVIGKISGIKTTYKEKGEEKKGLSLKVEPLLKKIDLLEQEMLKSLLAAPDKTAFKGKDSDFKKLRKEYEEAKNQMLLPLNQIRSKIPSNQKFLKGSYQKIGEIRDSLNQLIEIYAKFKPLINIEGEILEVAVTQSLKMADYLGFSKFKDMLVEQTGGEHNLNIEYYDSKLFPSDFQILNSDKKMKSSSSQGKTDIFVQWKDQKIKISAKNQSINKGQRNIAHVVSQTPLLYLLQSLDTNFINHWLNLHSSQKAFNKNNQEYVVNISTKKKNYSEDFDSLMEESLFYLALSGRTQGRSEKEVVNTFLVNDKTQGKIRVFSIKDIINQGINNKAVIITGGGLSEKNRSWINNKKANSPEKRISEILTQLHNTKVSISFNINKTLGSFE